MRPTINAAVALHAAEPIIVTSKSRLQAIVRDAVEEGVRDVLDALGGDGDDRAGFGWVDNATAMRLLGLSRPTLARYRANKTVPFSKLGSNVYYRVVDLEAVLEDRAVRRDR